MKKTVKFLGLALMSVIVLASCKKEGCTDSTATNYNEEAKKDDGTCEYYVTDPVLSMAINDPIAGSMFGLGDTIHIDADAAYDGEEMHGYEINVINTSASPIDTVYSVHDHTHSTAIDYHGMWVNDVSMHSDMELHFTVYKDHNSSGEEMIVRAFHCHPM